MCFGSKTKAAPAAPLPPPPIPVNDPLPAAALKDLPANTGADASKASARTKSAGTGLAIPTT